MNKVYIGIISLLFVMLVGLGVFFVINNNRLNEKIDELEKKLETKETTNPVETVSKEYVGNYKNTDGYSGSYIILNNDMTFERNYNFCEGYDVLKGTYTVEDGNIIVIPHDSGSFRFRYQNNQLLLIDDSNTYAYYDCSNARIFQKN